MAKTKRGFIFAAFIISCGATVLAIAAMATENWISASLKPIIVGAKGNGLVTYGLFYGSFKNNPTGSNYNTQPITCECIVSENGCAYSSQKTKEDRVKEINRILSGEDCSNNTKIRTEISTENLVNFTPDISIEVFEENKVMYNRKKSEKLIHNENNERYNVSEINRNIHFNKDVQQNRISNNKCDPTFLNMGLYITTLMFLSIAILIGAITAIITLRNVVGNPVNPWFNIWGLYIWNSLAASIYVLTIILWGVAFELYIKKNVAIIETLKGQYTNNEVELGYSYWILLVAILLHVLNCGLFYLRQYFIDKEPEILDQIDTNTDGMIFVY